MKIGLVSSLMKDNDMLHQVEVMKNCLKHSKDYDLLCFGESFLQGFEGLTWDYKEDIKRAIDVKGPLMDTLKGLTKIYNCGISFGFIEKENHKLFSSNIVINNNGDVVDLFRRVSKGWKESIATKDYLEGTGFHTFTYKDKVYATAICGDVWDDTFLEELLELRIDALLWPLYIDFSMTAWHQQYLDEYLERTSVLPYDVYMINSFVEDDNRSNGGCYVFRNGQVIGELSMGKMGVLTVEV
ncbi:MAG: hypothetical protein JEZ08_04720 [Clostridiales bacterium]|nr:hypothetical protein [Clostridiales bacterium]